MAKIDVPMPQMGESIAEGTLSKWIKKVGDAVKRDEPIFEISTDKVDAEIPAPTAGVLAEILVQEGQTVAINTIVARIETDASAAASAPAPAAAAPAPVAAAPAPAAPKAEAPKPAPAPMAAPAPAPAMSTGTMSAEERLRTKSTPLVRKMAAEHNVDISQLSGTGMAGRVTKADLEGFLAGGGSTAPVARAPEAGAPPAPRAPAAPVQSGAVAHNVTEPWEGDRVEPWSRIRKLTADHMIMSRRTSAHVNTFFEIDYTRIVGLRAKKKKEYADRGVNLTYTAFIVKAVADNLRKHPVINAAVTGDATLFRRDVNIGMAVALDWGLIVPVIKRADELSLMGIARAVNDLGERARTKKLSPDEVQKGTFTITNPGTFGSVIGTPIINQPQVAILCVGTIEKQPAVITLPDGTDTIGIRTKGMLSLAFDHRIVDGSDADRFMADVKKTLQEFPESAV
ncbi:MAG TPA: dihydrolipoamide acetyltransferase family protein [Gemmatimonadales bacterium]|nr:dihydrolipoamide acetyltransferase family protein [Gemmatimonadales bacterium]